MIPEAILRRISHAAAIGAPDVVLLDVLSIYLLQELSQGGLLEHMAFKGGNALRRIFAHRGTRFSRDLDFVDASYVQLSDEGYGADHYYYHLLEHLDGRTMHGIRWQVPALTDEELHQNTLHVELQATITDYQPLPDAGPSVLTLDLSFRRPILLGRAHRQLRPESWFKHLEFEPPQIPVLHLEEALAEKIRAAFQRNNPRDVYDLYQYGHLTFDQDLVRMLAVLKCWQDRGTYTGPKNFDPEVFMAKLTLGTHAWEHLRPQIAAHDWVDPPKLLQFVRERFGFMSQLTEREEEQCADRWQRSREAHDAIWESCKAKHARED